VEASHQGGGRGDTQAAEEGERVRQLRRVNEEFRRMSERLDRFFEKLEEAFRELLA